MLAEWLPARGLVLEVASGSASMRLAFARTFPDSDRQPSDPDPDALSSIEAWRADLGLANMREPVILDGQLRPVPVEQAGAVLNINMVHISPWDAALGLLNGAGRDSRLVRR